MALATLAQGKAIVPAVVRAFPFAGGATGPVAVPVWALAGGGWLRLYDIRDEEHFLGFVSSRLDADLWVAEQYLAERERNQTR